MTRLSLFLYIIMLILITPAFSGTQPLQTDRNSSLPDEFSWVLDSPVLTSFSPPDDERFSVKDPTIVRFEGNWHLFYSVRSKKRSHQIEYITFEFIHTAILIPRSRRRRASRP